MNKYFYILFLILSIAITSFSQRKTSEHELKNIPGLAIGGEPQTPEQVTAAIREAYALLKFVTAPVFKIV